MAAARYATIRHENSFVGMQIVSSVGSLKSVNIGARIGVDASLRVNKSDILFFVDRKPDVYESRIRASVREGIG